jgi:hypothetical protein
VLIPWSSVLLDRLTVPQLVKKFAAFYGTQRFITLFERVCVCCWYEETTKIPIEKHALIEKFIDKFVISIENDNSSDEDRSDGESISGSYTEDLKLFIAHLVSL